MLHQDPRLSADPDIHVGVPQQKGKFKKCTSANRRVATEKRFNQCSMDFYVNKPFKQIMPNNAEFPWFRTLSTFTTIDRQWSRKHKRWLCAIEKLAAQGYPVTPEVSKIYGVVT